MTNSIHANVSSAPRLRSVLQITAVLLALVTAGFWAAKGAHRGWSQNQVPVHQKDEITGLDYVTYEKRFIPGVEFLGGGLGLAAGLFVVSIFCNRKNNHQPSS